VCWLLQEIDETMKKEMCLETFEAEQCGFVVMIDADEESWLVATIPINWLYRGLR
jgi:hypothetical protein